MKTVILAAAFVSSAYAAGCVPIAGDRILGRDLALANPVFATLPAGVTIAYAPAPGTKRVFAQAELARIARANSINSANDVDEVCFEIPMRPIEDEDVVSSMRRSLPLGTELTLVELPKVAVPVGSVEFPITGLEPAAQGARLWRGYVKYGETLRMRIWARVNVRCRVEAVVAVTDLAYNVPIDAGHLRLETINAPIGQDRSLARQMEQVIGRVPKQLVCAGSAIPLALLETPLAVHRGDAVKVEVRSGLARIQIDAIAEGSARTGDMVQLRNPLTGKTFRARLEGASKAVLVVGAGRTL